MRSRDYKEGGLINALTSKNNKIEKKIFSLAQFKITIVSN